MRGRFCESVSAWHFCDLACSGPVFPRGAKLSSGGNRGWEEIFIPEGPFRRIGIPTVVSPDDAARKTPDAPHLAATPSNVGRRRCTRHGRRRGRLLAAASCLRGRGHRTIRRRSARRFHRSRHRAHALRPHAPAQCVSRRRRRRRGSASIVGEPHQQESPAEIDFHQGQEGIRVKRRGSTPGVSC